MDEVIKIVNDIKAGNIKPIYFLMGEEPYYIAKLSDYEPKIIYSELHYVKVPENELNITIEIKD